MQHVTMHYDAYGDASQLKLEGSQDHSSAPHPRIGAQRGLQLLLDLPPQRDRLQHRRVGAASPATGRSGKDGEERGNVGSGPARVISPA